MRPIADIRAAAAIARRRFRAGSASTAVFVGLVGVTAFLAVGMPRLYASALDEAARRAIDALDARGAWAEGGRLREADPDNHVNRIITTQTFIKNLDTLSRYLAADR